MPRIGIDADTFLSIVGWESTRQSVQKIVRTQLGERVLRRNTGSAVPNKLDRPQNQEELLDLFMSIAEGLEYRVENDIHLGEPNFQVTSMAVTPSPDGTITIEVTGIHYPKGHLGDYTPENQLITVSTGAS